MNLPKIFAAFPLIVLLATGCRNVPLIVPPLDSSSVSSPQDITKTMLGKVAGLTNLATGFPGFFGIREGLNSTNKAIKLTRSIATQDGKSVNLVTINYTDLTSLNSLDPKTTLLTVFNLGGSMLKLAPVSPATNLVVGPLQLPDLLKSLPLDLSSGITSSRSAEDFLNAQTAAIQNLQAFLTLLQKFQSLQETNFQTALSGDLRQLLEDQLSTVAIKQTNSLEIDVSLDAIMAAYMDAYLNGNFVDRWGTTLSQPDMAKLGNDTAVAAVQVALEAIFDYAMMTPLIHDSSQTGSTNTPTFAVLFPQLYEDISADPDAPGITTAENEAINYLSGLSGEGAKHLSALIVKSLGGASFGVKISTGDNSTFAQIVSTFAEEFFRRSTEESTYDFLEKFQYGPSAADSVLGYSPDFAANATNITALKDFCAVDEPFQEAVVAALVSQDELKALSKGGWKLSASNITNYQALAGNLLGTNAVAVQIFPQLTSSIQAALKSKSTLDSVQQTALIDALNQLIQTNGVIFDPSQHTEVTLSPEATAVLHQQPGNSPLQHVQHLNMLLLMDALGQGAVVK